MAEEKTDPKLTEFQNKIQKIDNELSYVSSYVTPYMSPDGFFDIEGQLLKSDGPFLESLKKLYNTAKEKRNAEDIVDDKGSTYVIVVKDPTAVYSTRNPKNWTIDDVIYYKYTEPYSDASKQKEKDQNGKTPLKRFKIMERELKNSPDYKSAKSAWKEGCKVYTTWAENVGKERQLKKKKAEIEAQRDKYIETKKQKEAAQQKKIDNSKSVSAVKEELRKYTDGEWGPNTFLKCSTAAVFLGKFYKFHLGEMYNQEYIKLGVDSNGDKYKEQSQKFDKLKNGAKDVVSAQEVVDAANKTLEDYKKAYTEDKKNAKADYSKVESLSASFQSAADALVQECSEYKHKAEEEIGKRQQQEIDEAKNSSGEADKELNKKEFADNLQPKTFENLKNFETTGQGGLEGKSTSPGMAGGPGELNQAQTAGSFSNAENNEEKKEEPQDPTKFKDEDKWTDDEIKKLKGKAAGLTEQQAAAASVQMTDALANMATNIIGAFATDPMLAGQVSGMISTGTFNAQSLEGMGNMMLASSVNTLTNAMMNTLGVGAVEEVMDDALSATATILTTATNIVPMIKELTVATVMTVTDELTSHIVEKVESILDPTAITSQITYYMGYYTSLYTASADDLKKKLLSPGDAAMSDALEAKTEEDKNAKMVNMMAKITDLKNKASEGIAMAKSGVKMVTTYINNGPDWVVKQLSTYTNFAIAQAEKYIDYGAEYVIDQRDSFVSMIGESIGKRVAEKVNKAQEQTLKKAIDYIEVKKKYATQVAMAAIMTAVQMVVAQLGPMIGMALKMGAKMGMKQLLKTIGG